MVTHSLTVQQRDLMLGTIRSELGGIGILLETAHWREAVTHPSLDACRDFLAQVEWGEIPTRPSYDVMLREQEWARLKATALAGLDDCIQNNTAAIADGRHASRESEAEWAASVQRLRGCTDRLLEERAAWMQVGRPDR